MAQETEDLTSSLSPSPSPPPPPLPPRRKVSGEAPLQVGGQLQSKPTTAVSSIDISTLSFPDGTRGTFPTPSVGSGPSPLNSGYGTPSRDSSGDNLTDSMSVMSFAPTVRAPGDLASLVAGEFNRKSRAWNLLRSQSETVQPFEAIEYGDSGELSGFEKEFDNIPENLTDDVRLSMWQSKMKHYLILSSAGKPIWSRHGDLSLINSSMGVIQTIISFYEGAKDPLMGFTAGKARFVVLTAGPLYFVAISKLGESDAQLRGQLEALYMQILSTLTLPTLKNIFVHRPSTDLRKPLEGTETLLSSLADSFTKGSPTALLGALECLKLRKSQRHAINNIFLKNRTDQLLYGLIVAGGKLVSVIRPRKHSLHPSDLQLIFNMLFESGSVKSGGGESWIPICLPAFNNSGYLYMYVSFFDDDDPPSTSKPTTTTNNSNNNTTPTIPEEGTPPPPPPPPPPSSQPDPESQEIALILISPSREAFYPFSTLRHTLLASLTKSAHLPLIRSSLSPSHSRPSIPSILPPSHAQAISHFIYKSRPNVQFLMSSLHPSFTSPLARRKLFSQYQTLHAAAHAKHAHLKVIYSVGEDCASLGWVTPLFELYCVAGPNVSRQAMTEAANRVVKWVGREEGRVFIIGGGVF
ncbi:trafficking protein Mon1-domain-containing protein [Cercophora samala]|uniref:Vacuolar fusion protein MON1 n=1 Tax=Cercophora samala TaxID=330535 RepID=A0AA39ZLD3_9PEZI|nr:trafficking protein Mon1-domain-containing protein [Cercophora samala]